jgi:hypothetical protein
MSGQTSLVIASGEAARQSRAAVRLAPDCFATLAMTKEGVLL